MTFAIHVLGQIIPYPYVSVTMFHIYLIRGLKDQNDFRSKLRILFAARRIQHLLQTKATSQKSNPYPSLEEKGAPLACLWLSIWNEKHLKWLFCKHVCHSFVCLFFWPTLLFAFSPYTWSYTPVFTKMETRKSTIWSNSIMSLSFLRSKWCLSMLFSLSFELTRGI